MLFLSYLGLDEGLSDFTLAWTRFVDILIGIVAAVIVGTTIWPNHARVRYLLAVSNTMEKATDYCKRRYASRFRIADHHLDLQMSRDLLRSSLVYQVNDQVYTRLEREVRVSLHMKSELTIVIHIHQSIPNRDPKERSLPPTPTHQALFRSRRIFRSPDGNA